MTKFKDSGITHPDLFEGESRVMTEMDENEKNIYVVDVQFTRTTYESGNVAVYVRVNSEDDAIQIAEETVERDEEGWADEIRVEGDVMEMINETEVPEGTDVLGA